MDQPLYIMAGRLYPPTTSGHHTASESTNGQYGGRGESTYNAPETYSTSLVGNAPSHHSFVTDPRAVAAHSGRAEYEREKWHLRLTTTASATAVSDARRAASVGVSFRRSPAGVGATVPRSGDVVGVQPRGAPTDQLHSFAHARNALLLEAMSSREAALLQGMAGRELLVWTEVKTREDAFRRERAARDAALLQQRADMGEAYQLVQLYLTRQQQQQPAVHHALVGEVAATAPTPRVERPRVGAADSMTAARCPPAPVSGSADIPIAWDEPAGSQGAPPPPRPSLPNLRLSAMVAAPANDGDVGAAQPSLRPPAAVSGDGGGAANDSLRAAELQKGRHDGWRCSLCGNISDLQDRVACVYCGKSCRCLACGRVGGAETFSYVQALGVYRMHCASCRETRTVQVSQLDL